MHKKKNLSYNLFQPIEVITLVNILQKKLWEKWIYLKYANDKFNNAPLYVAFHMMKIFNV